MVLEIHGPRASAAAPAVLLGGVGLEPTWAFYPYLAEQIARDRPVLVPVPPAPYSLSAEREGLAALVAAITAGERPPGRSWDGRSIGLIGHGKGASLGMLVAAEHAAVEGIVAIAPLCTFNRLAAHDESIRADMAAHGGEFQLEVVVRGLMSTVVVIACEEDHIVPIVEAETVFHWLPKEASSFVLLEKTGHSLGAQHPFEGSNRELDRVVRIVRELFERVL